MSSLNMVTEKVCQRRLSRNEEVRPLPAGVLFKTCWKSSEPAIKPRPIASNGLDPTYVNLKRHVFVQVLEIQWKEISLIPAVTSMVFTSRKKTISRVTFSGELMLTLRVAGCSPVTISESVNPTVTTIVGGSCVSLHEREYAKYLQKHYQHYKHNQWETYVTLNSLSSSKMLMFSCRLQGFLQTKMGLGAGLVIIASLNISVFSGISSSYISY